MISDKLIVDITLSECHITSIDIVIVKYEKVIRLEQLTP